MSQSKKNTSGHGEKKSRKQELAIAALLLHGTVESAAEDAGISPSTLKRWLADDAFVQDFRKARQSALAAAISRLQHDSFRAAAVLSQHLESDDAKIAIRAATAILDRSLRGAELLDIAERVEELEKQLGDEK